MALNPLTLDVNYGVAGRPFQATISGASAGSTIEVLADGTPGFGFSNGRVTMARLPGSAPTATVVLRETKAGEGVRDSRIDISVDGIALGAAGLNRRLDEEGLIDSKPSVAYRGGFALFLGQYKAGQYTERDASGNGADATPAALTNPAQADRAANPGYVTFLGNNSSQAFVVSKAKVPLNLATDSFALAFTIKMSAPANTVFLMGNQVDTTKPGIKLIVDTSGRLQVMVTLNSSNPATTPPSISIADGNEHRVMVVFDGKSGDIIYFVDGAPIVTQQQVYNASVSTGSGVINDTDFFIGASGFGGTASQAPAMQLAAAMILRFPNGLPLNLAQIARRYNDSPRRLFADNEFADTALWRVLMIVAPGQSNENGSASVPDVVRQLGAPLADGVRPKGGKGSMWPALSEAAGARGGWLQVVNLGVGSTSILHDWCGVLRAWTANMKVDKGTYTLSGGNVYKVTATAGSAQGVTSTVQPTGTAATQTGADNITWTYMAAARAQDVDGYIYPYTDAYFDPNGYLAQAKGFADNGRGYDAKWAYVALGQQDFSLGTTRAEFRQGLINATNFWLAAGVKVMLGVTVYGTQAGQDAWLTSNPAATAATNPATDTAPGVGGWYDALQAFAGNPNVVAGANLRYELGVLPTSASLGALAHVVPGLEGDGIHANLPALRLAATLIDAKRAW